MSERQLRFGAVAGLRDGWAMSGTIAELVHERAGARSMIHVLCYIGLWGRYVDTIGHEPPSVLNMAQTLDVPQRTLARWSHLFADAFPELDSPTALWDLARPQIEHVEDVPAEVLAVELGAVKP